MDIDGHSVYHLVAKIERRDVSLCEFEVGSWVWRRLRVAFPAALAVCLMPDHPHVVTPMHDPAEGRARLNRLLGQLARRAGVRYLGEAAEPTEIVDHQKLLRHLRYVALNPARAKLTDDPLAWLFSTHRDVMGAAVDPWIDGERLAKALRRQLEGFSDWYHRYVSSDPAVRVDGSPPPRPAMPDTIARVPLGRIARAAAAATRARPESIRSVGLTRAIFIALAREQAWSSSDVLARACGCTTRTIQRIACVDVELRAARVCLGDARLLRGVPAWAAAPAFQRVIDEERR